MMWWLLDLRAVGTVFDANGDRQSLRLHRWMKLGIPIGAILAVGSSALACDCGCEELSTASVPLLTTLSQVDFFTNYGQYMPRMHCLRSAGGGPDWPWIAFLITLHCIVIAGYLRIYHFWRRCYLEEEPRDRDRKLMDLANVFALCALSGYGLSIVIFFWPVYRLQAMMMLFLAYLTWKFASDLEPFRKSFTAIRLHRQLNDKLEQDNLELVQANDQLRSAHQELTKTAKELQETNRDLDQFAYAASHDLRSPLRAIDNLTQMVIEDAGEDLSEPVMDDLRNIQTRVHRMDRMLAGLLNYSRMRNHSENPESMSVLDACQEAIAVLEIPKGFSVEVECEDLVVVAQRAPLEQVLRNLIDNSIKHHDRDRGSVHVRFERDKDVVRFFVADDGPGIAREHEERVFGVFQTLRRKDELDTTGMGLAMVKRLVESHGGTIHFEANGDRGVVFSFTWPFDVSDTCVDRQVQERWINSDSSNECGAPCHV